MTRTIPINPKLPRDFDNTPNNRRPRSHLRWWNRPYIETLSVEDLERDYAQASEPDTAREYWQREGRAKWLAAWPSGTRYDVRCLDGGAWDRSTNRGQFATLEEALAVARAIAFNLDGVHA